MSKKLYSLVEVECKNSTPFKITKEFNEEYERNYEGNYDTDEILKKSELTIEKTLDETLDDDYPEIICFNEDDIQDETGE